MLEFLNFKRYNNLLSISLISILLFFCAKILMIKPMVNLVLMIALAFIFVFSKFLNIKIKKSLSTSNLFFILTLLCCLPLIIFFSNFNNFIVFEINNEYLPFFLDGISLWLIWLSTIIGFVLFWGIDSEKLNFTTKFYNSKLNINYNTILLLIIGFSITCFIVKNIFIFFIFFEMIMLPLVFHILTQGSRVNSTLAVKYLVMFTLVGSIFLWIPVVYFIEILGTADFDVLRWLIIETVNGGTRKLLFLSLFLGFSFKVPLVPFHQWLIIAHVEAPTSGSILLAALLLKVGGYGLYRFAYNLFPLESFMFSSEIIILSLFGYTYATLLAIKQIDIKRFIAYTSISHMNFSLVGLFSGFEIGILGFIHTMISHGIIATGLFYLVGYIYSNVGYRDTLRISGLSETLPVFSIFWFLFSIANMGMPLFSAFPGELFIIISLANVNYLLVIFTFFGFFFTGVYTFLQINKVLFSNYRGYSSSMLNGKVTDLSAEAIITLIVLLMWTLLLGIFPDILLKNIEF